MQEFVDRSFLTLSQTDGEEFIPQFFEGNDFEQLIREYEPETNETENDILTVDEINAFFEHVLYLSLFSSANINLSFIAFF